MEGEGGVAAGAASSWYMAPWGQVKKQEPQSLQREWSITAVPATISIASVGHAFTQVPQPVQLLISTWYMISLLFVAANI